MASLWRNQESFIGSTGGWRMGCSKKRSSPVDDDPNQTSPCKRFASEELVTAHFRELDLSSSPHTHHMVTPHTHHTVTPHALTSSHPLTECPGYAMTGHPPSYASQWSTAWGETVGADNKVLTRGASPVELIDDTSFCWGKGEETGPPVYPVRATPSSQWQWATPCYTPSSQFDWSLRSPVSVVSEEPAASSPCIDDLSPGDSPSISPPRSPVRCTSLWREVTMEENSSDGSDGDSEPSGPERPLSLWLSPELIECADKIPNPLPQSLLEKYKKPAGMEIMLWVDPTTRLKATMGSDEVEMADSTEAIANNYDMDL